MKLIKSLPEYGKRIVICPARSRILLLLIASLHTVALLLLFVIKLNVLLLLILAILIVSSLRQLIILEKSITHGLSLQQGESLLFQKDEISDWQEADVLESFVCRWLIVLKIRTLLDSKQHSMVIAADSIDVLLFRRLCVFLNGHHGQ